jgi:solute carrier family 25 citrate transporter 1
MYVALAIAARLRNIYTDDCAVAKTRSQLNRRLADGKKLPWPPFGKQWYAGCTTLIIGNSLKAGISTLATVARRRLYLTHWSCRICRL